MKSNFTLACKVSLAIALIFSNFIPAYSHNNSQSVLSGTPVIFSNTANRLIDVADDSSQNRFSCSNYTKSSIGYNRVLPVNYSSFDAVVIDQKVKLNWIIDAEMNDENFEVERSLDGKSFSTIGLVLGSDISADNKSTYRFKDYAAILKKNNIVYYRLKHIGKEGNITFSYSLPVQLEAKTGMQSLASPNPFVNKIDIHFQTNQTGISEIRIINLAGQTVLSKQIILKKGLNKVSLTDLNGLSKGIYIAKFFINGEVIDHQKILKD